MIEYKPSIIQRFRLAAEVFRRGLPWSKWARSQKAAPFVWPAWREDKPEWQILNYAAYIEEGFNLNSLIYSAIMYKARSIIAAPLTAYTGDVRQPEPLPPKDPLAKLLARPNPHQSQAVFLQQYEAYLNVAGNAYLHLDRPLKGGLPIAMRWLRPDRVYIVPAKGGIRGYIYVPEGKTPHGDLRRDDVVPILPSDLCHIKLPNPGDPLEGFGYGLSPISAIAYSADVDNDTTRFLKIFFQRGTMGNTVIEFDQPVPEQELARARERFMEVYGGYENWADVFTLGSGGHLKRINMTFQEMGFGELDERNEARILGPFGVPGVLIGSRLGLNRAINANAEELRRMFWQDVMIPEMSLLESALDYYLTADDPKFIRFDTSQVPALRQDIFKQIEGASRLFAMGIPVNVACQAVGLDIEDIPGGDIGYLPLNLVPVGQPRPTPALPAGGQGNETESPEKPPKEPEQDNADSANAEEETRKMRPFQRKGFTPEAKANLWKAIDAIATSWEQRFAEATETCFERDKRELLALLNEYKSKALERKETINWVAYSLDVAKYLRENANGLWRETFVPLMQGVMRDQAKHWETALGTQFDVENLWRSEWFTHYQLVFAQDINQTSSNELSELLQQASREGWSIETMSKRMGQVFRQWQQGDLTPEDFDWIEQRKPQFRRDNIARSESMRAANASNLAIYAEYGAPGSEWYATMDNRTRPEHMAAHGQIRKLGEPFDVGGEKLIYPGDPNGSAGNTCQCRCTTLPVLEADQ